MGALLRVVAPALALSVATKGPGGLAAERLFPLGGIMTKRDLIDEVNKRFPHLSRRDSEVIVNSVFDSMVSAMGQGERIEIRGFGSFVVKHRRAREGRNPKSGAVVSVSAKRVPFFKVGKELRLRVDGKGEARKGSR